MQSDDLAARGAPERIWIMPAKDQWARGTGEWMAEFWGLPTETPYILATPAALAASPEVARMLERAILDAQLRCMERGRLDMPDEIRAAALRGEKEPK